ncbi:hypothetical protein K6119_10915 [Paracrocinitomix mangrovi]|uniref:hypothetical protein n=1 Tax=Paracrocinitomix mangrovi TaxID=2862509 RepID=UPI001C8EBD74|nr:hypothetical protein [Paracrocinitomix mangrovi]UKN00244.1 hypothetical protein K6119_10915 [Paracrocinitomix mangrovi]
MIVVTGLDGSGKSTFLSMLKDQFTDQIEVLHLPKTEPQKFANNAALKDACDFVNQIGERADMEQIPALKIIAMFGSMILFNDLAVELRKNGKTVFAERHPLIDTAVYAAVYYHVMHPDNLDDRLANQLDKEYEAELNLIIQKVNHNIGIQIPIQSKALLKFLHEWFSDESNISTEKLSELFGVQLPDSVYFLDAPPETLMSRIQGRNDKEFHESLSLLQKMRPIYLKVLAQSQIKHQIIDSTSMHAFDELIKIIQKESI